MIEILEKVVDEDAGTLRVHVRFDGSRVFWYVTTKDTPIEEVQKRIQQLYDRSVKK